MQKDYDIEDAFAAIEDELIDSMIRNMKRHRLEEEAEEKQWEMWQALQLRSLEEYKKKNQEKFTAWFSDINRRIEEVIKEANRKGYMDQELEILDAIKKGFKGYRKSSNTLQAEFFKLNERKLEALIKATTDDMKRAEVAILRMADDQYRKTIFNAQVYANTGAGTYEKAIDMATKDMLSAGLNCIEYANGARHTLKDYADMALRTASKRAYLQGEGTKRQEWGISTVIMNKRGNPCPKCLPFCGKVLIDDVWSGGSRNDGPYPLMSKAIAAGLYHPRCKDSHTTYFEGISTLPDGKYTKKEIKRIEADYQKEQKQQYTKRQVEKFERLGKYSLDEDNKREYSRKSKFWNSIRKKMDILKDHEELMLAQLPEEHKNKIISMLDTSDARIQRFTLKYSDEVGFININAKSGAVSTRRGIRVNLMEDKDNIRGGYTSTFHEMGHSLDRASGNISHEPRFKEALIDDFENIVRSYKLLYNMSTEEVYENIGRNIRAHDQHSISDIVSGITRNKCRGKYSHDLSYWEKPHKLEREAFAHFYEAYARNDADKIEMLSQMFPQATEIFFELLEGL